MAKEEASLRRLQEKRDAAVVAIATRPGGSETNEVTRCFDLVSGLKVNIDKSSVMGVGVPANEVAFMTSSLR
ncbi:hypothetical protein Tco_1323905 [Tanacetum coccineum]